MARVNNKYKVTRILQTTNGGKKVTLTPVYSGDPEYTSGVALADNAERSIEILVPKNSSSQNFFTLNSEYNMDFTAV